MHRSPYKLNYCIYMPIWSLLYQHTLFCQLANFIFFGNLMCLFRWWGNTMLFMCTKRMSIKKITN